MVLSSQIDFRFPSELYSMISNVDKSVDWPWREIWPLFARIFCSQKISRILLNSDPFLNKLLVCKSTCLSICLNIQLPIFRYECTYLCIHVCFVYITDYKTQGQCKYISFTVSLFYLALLFNPIFYIQGISLRIILLKIYYSHNQL